MEFIYLHMHKRATERQNVKLKSFHEHACPPMT